MAVDVGQIISVWDIIADEEISTDQISWTPVTALALNVLEKISPRNSDLQEFGEILSQQRSKSLAIDCQDLAI
jgi:hypothetical protein